MNRNQRPFFPLSYELEISIVLAENINSYFSTLYRTTLSGENKKPNISIFDSQIYFYENCSSQVEPIGQKIASEISELKTDPNMSRLKNLLYLLKQLKFYYNDLEANENSNPDEFVLWRMEFNRQFYQIACFYQNNPAFVLNFNWKYSISDSHLDMFMNFCSEYEKKLGIHKWTMLELIDYLLHDEGFKPFFVFYYDKRQNSRSEPLITQAIFTRTDCNMFIRVSYNSYKFGLFRYYPFEKSNDNKIRFDRKRVNEVYKYSEGFFIPSMSNPNHWRFNECYEDLVRKAHHKLNPMPEGHISFTVEHMKGKQEAYFDVEKARDVKINKY